MLLRHLTRFGPLIAGNHGQYNRALLAAGQHHRLIACRYFSQELVANWPEGIRKFLENEKIEKPTLIQERTLPIAMENKNLVGIARTGSGKTLAFVIPAVMKVLKAREESDSSNHRDNDDKLDEDFLKSISRGKPRKPTCLVLAPTRELAMQTSDVFQKFQRLGINTIPLVGGASRSDQLHKLQRQHYDVYVATPGRLIDLVESELVDLSGIKYLVLDEADRMLDMGFEPQIRRILERMPKERQTLMWSATWPQEIQELAQEFLHDYKYIAVDSEKLKANPNIKQVVEICQPSEKLQVLLENMQKFKEECNQPRVLIFVNTKRMADSMILHLMRNKVRAISIHGDRSQNQRDHALRMFRERQCHVLVATDVAARGIDVSDITHVVNFDTPNTVEDYIHRIGRTARHEREGIALTLFTTNDASLAPKLVQVLRETNQEVPEELTQMQSYATPARKMRGYGRGGNRGGYGDDRYGRNQSGDMYRRGGDRNDFGYRRTNDRFSYDRRGESSRYSARDESEDEDESPYERNDRYDRSGRGRRARGGIFDD